ncbi:Mg2+ transporter protein CorA-like/Zinc transport protein ZntB [Lasiodiplodia theobromae]|uniref:Mg2+ transporter protein CorA-like/Zinc transport protein ZntB n=1 Tax=Lasiodiplodia theobromae TaxID=45133 RepID=A0A8H7IR17_9PEZI|nr:Mg2+ transporter protein CorA-like/Zinc transport protein ZntB [Lasiodiplodia theobromae]
MDPLEKDVQQQTAPTPGDWHADPYWRGRRISPAQLLVHDIRLDEQSGGGYRQRHDAAPLLEIKEVMTSAFAAEVSQRGRDRLRGKLVDDAEGLLAKAGVSNRTELYRVKSLVAEYGWMAGLRSLRGEDDDRMCRWM